MTAVASGTYQLSSQTLSVPKRVLDNIATAVRGNPRAARLAVVALLAGGHVLIDDVPGVGKTTLARSLAVSVDAEVSRIQFTHDLLPADIVGSSVFNQRTSDFRFAPGPVFANIVIADEINRASPKTQAALLEAMQEGSVTVDGDRHPLPKPFMVVATQNPVEMEGTFPLPEAQLDRFMMSFSIGYPSVTEQLAMLDQHESGDPVTRLQPVVSVSAVETAIAELQTMYMAPALKRYIINLAEAVRDDDSIALGVSPRATIQLMRAAKVLAALSGRDYTTPDDIQQLLIPVWAHRLVLSTQARSQGLTPAAVLTATRDRLPVE